MIRNLASYVQYPRTYMIERENQLNFLAFQCGLVIDRSPGVNQACSAQTGSAEDPSVMDGEATYRRLSLQRAVAELLIPVGLPGRAGDGFRKQVTLERLLWSAESVGCSLEKGELQVTVRARARGAAENRQTREGLTDGRRHPKGSDAVSLGGTQRRTGGQQRWRHNRKEPWAPTTALLSPLHLSQCSCQRLPKTQPRCTGRVCVRRPQLETLVAFPHR
ncbi:uncharacterized protein LOC127670134 [Apodemus sylvaticus]|uniref:uncharacterized protein LOC127670134 n=1 Tax=Apodemus sylvaticus TaxID=10129 RepID=UPI002242C6F5|nr:uncharacterized protein LOC127670134 [Apodemus sylvaticus]